LLEFTLDSQSFGVSDANYLRSLAQIDSAFEDLQNKDNVRANFTNEAIYGVTFSITAGILSWVLRGGSLLASVLASTPVWSSIDPVRVISKSEREDSPDEVEDLFDKK